MAALTGCPCLPAYRDCRFGLGQVPHVGELSVGSNPWWNSIFLLCIGTQIDPSIVASMAHCDWTNITIFCNGVRRFVPALYGLPEVQTFNHASFSEKV